jgi:hypothetical protein
MEDSLGAQRPKTRQFSRIRFAMSGSDRPEQTTGDGVQAGARPACVALVPVIPAVQWSRVPDQLASRADFVAHLIATAEHVPQTRSLRRATPADAQTAYRACQSQHPGAGGRTRQII